MTISDRRWRKAHKVATRAFDDSSLSWGAVVSTGANSTWMPAGDELLLFDRDPERLAEDLRAIWTARGRQSFDPLADVVADIAERMRGEPLGKGGSELSSTVYSMH